MTNKARAKWDKQFVSAMVAHLLTRGATTRPAPGGVEYQLTTQAGPLTVAVYEGWLACRFRDVELARTLLQRGLAGRLNPHSGKWNFHFGWGSDIEECVKAFGRELSFVMPG